MKVETEMNIDIAVKHLSWRLQQTKMIPNSKDKEAFNFILDTLNKNYDETLMQDTLFAKLLIEKLLQLTYIGERSMADAIRIVKEILSKSLFSMACEFQSHVPLIRMNLALEQKFIMLNLSDDDRKNAVKVAAAKNKLINEFQKELVAELKKPYSLDEFNDFLKRLVFELKHEYQNKP